VAGRSIEKNYFLICQMPLDSHPLQSPAPSEPEIDEELFPFFVEETREWLKILDQELQALARNWNVADRLIVLRRLFHTLKGASFSVGHVPIGTLAGDIEQLFKGLSTDQAREHEALVIRICLSMADTTRAYLEQQGDPSHAPRRQAEMGAVLASVRELGQRTGLTEPVAGGGATMTPPAER
jgi:chemosensory pili system protein ChpA (sensor histidine kinase/response regulator)